MMATMIDALFGAALFINALLFIPQIITILREKSSRGVSITTFLGFFLIQLSAVLYGAINHDEILMLGYLLSMLLCGTVVILAFIYHGKKQEDPGCSLEEVVDQMPIHMYWKDEKGTVLACSELQAQTLGFSSNKDPGLIGKNVYDFFPKEEADVLLANDREVLESGQTKVFEEVASIPSGEKRLYWSCKTPLRNKHNKIIGLLGVSADITHAKQDVEDRLAMLEHIIGLMPGHVYWMNKDGIYLGCNNNQAISYGLSSRKEIVGKKPEDLHHSTDPDNFMQEFSRSNYHVITTGEELLVEEESGAAREDGVMITFLSNKAPLRNSRNEIVGMVGVSFDITERKRLQMLQMQKNIDDKNKQVMNLLAGSIAHELRTPLAIININLDLLTRSNKNDELPRDERIRRIEKYSEVIRQCIRDTTQVINMILIKLRHVISNKVEDKNFREYSISETIEEAVSLYPFKPNEEKLVRFDKTEEDFKYHGDLILTRHVLFNLIKNGLRAVAEAGFGEVIINLNLHDKKYNRVEIVDTAGGISTEMIAKVFSKFENNDPSQNGAGLGLPFCKLVMESYEGDVVCDSDEKTYTRFTLIFPR